MLAGCHEQTVGTAIDDFHEPGLGALPPKSSRPHPTHEVFDKEARQQLPALLHLSPRPFGKDTSIWTLQLAAQVSFAGGIGSRPISAETIRHALKLVGGRCKGANQWISSPDPDDVRKTNRRDSLIRLVLAPPTWVLGLLDEVCWSRLAQPDQHRWAEQDELTRLQETECRKQETDPKALACYAVLRPNGQEHADQMLLPLVDGRPLSTVTLDFLRACCKQLQAQSVAALVLIWDHGWWHKSQMLRTWVGNHHQTVKQTGKGVRILACLLPSKSPWLNPIEAKWVHGKRHGSEADRILSAHELEARVCASYASPPQPHLLMPKKVA